MVRDALEVAQLGTAAARWHDVLKDFLLLLGRVVGARADRVEVLEQERVAALLDDRARRAGAVRLLKLFREGPVVVGGVPREAQRRALRLAIRRGIGDVPLLEVRAERGQHEGHDCALDLRGLNDLVLVALERVRRQEDEWLLLTIPIRVRIASGVAAHATGEALHKRVSLRGLRTLPDKGDMLFGHNLSCPQAAADDNERRHKRRVLEAFDGNLSLVSREVADLATNALIDGDGRNLLLICLLAVVKAREDVLVASILHDLLKVACLGRDVKGGFDQTAIIVGLEAKVVLAHLQLLNVLREALLVLGRREFRVWRSINRDNESILLVERLGVAVHGKAVAPEEDVEFLLLRLVHVRLIHDDERVCNVHRGTLEVLAEEHLDGTRGICCGVGGLRVLVRLVLELRLVRATEDVDLLNNASDEHQTDQFLEGARLASLAEGNEHCIAQHARDEHLEDVLCGGRLLEGAGHLISACCLGEY